MDTFITTYKFHVTRMLLISMEDPHLMVMLIVVSAALIIFGVIFAKFVFKSESNIFAVTLTVALPLLLVAVALTVGDLYIIDKLRSEALQITFQILLAAMVLFIVGVPLANKLLKLDWWKNTIILVMVYVMTLAAMIMTESIMKAIDSGKNNMKSYQQNNQGG